MRITWDDIKAAEPRLAVLEQATISYILDGPHLTADEVYGQVKRYAAALVGWRRHLPPQPRSAWRPGDETAPRWFVPVVAEPARRPDQDWLHSPAAYHVTVEELFATICAAAERRAA